MRTTVQAAARVSTPSGSTVVQRLAAGSGGATRPTRLPEACGVDLAAVDLAATALTSNRRSSAMVVAIAAARRGDAVAVATITDWTASVSYAQGRSGSWGYCGQRYVAR